MRAGAAAGSVVVVVAAVNGTEGARDEDLPHARDFTKVLGSPVQEGVKLICRVVLLIALSPADANLTLR